MVEAWRGSLRASLLGKYAPILSLARSAAAADLMVNRFYGLVLLAKTTGKLKASAPMVAMKARGVASKQGHG
jgi:hypothetical protein